MPTESYIKSIGDKAEAKVFDALSNLPLPWQVFNTVEWRTLGNYGEEVGEADAVVFHPNYGLIVFEIKAGQITIKDGQWFYASGQAMKQSPFSQARRNRYALAKKLENRLGKSVFDTLTITHAVWLPDVRWKNAVAILEAPSAAFVLDRSALEQPESALLKIFSDINTKHQAWTRSQQNMLKELLAPDCQLLMPLAYKLDDTALALHQATTQQVTILRMLRSQKRLLVDGGAGSGKTLLAVMLAKEHALLGKKVLFTCYNKALSQQVATQLADYPNIQVVNFHELVRQCAQQAGITHHVPEDAQARRQFFKEDCADLLMQAAELGVAGYDSIIVDEGADFTPTWWVALESLGNPDFNWYCFYDRHQAIFWSESQWSAPFAGEPMTLDVNLRNTKPVGLLASRLGHCPQPAAFRVEAGIEPEITVCSDFAHMADCLKARLQQLIVREQVAPERIVVLAPYKHSNLKSTWAEGLKGIELNEDMATPIANKVRIGTIQAFKGLEADVVILAGLTPHMSTLHELLYVGASRAKGALYVLSLVPLS